MKNSHGGSIIFADNKKDKIIRVGNIGNSSKPLIERVFLVEGLKHNLLSISQLCDNGFVVLFCKENY